MCDSSSSSCAYCYLCFLSPHIHTQLPHDTPLCLCDHHLHTFTTITPTLTQHFKVLFWQSQLTMDSKAILDYALFQLTPTRTRWISHTLFATCSDFIENSAFFATEWVIFVFCFWWFLQMWAFSVLWNSSWENSFWVVWAFRFSPQICQGWDL